jgi:hypothetical protein
VAGGLARANDAGGREVRPAGGLSLLHLRDVLIQPGDRPYHRQPGADDPAPPPRARPCGAPSARENRTGIRARARPGGGEAGPVPRLGDGRGGRGPLAPGRCRQSWSPADAPQGDSSLVGDLVRNPHAEDPSDRASLRAELSRLRSEIRRLHSRQREALTLRHGLGERSGEAGTMRERERPWASAPPRPPTTRSACSWCYGITSRRQAFGSSRGAAGRLRPVPHLAPFPKATLGVARQPYSDNQITK